MEYITTKDASAKWGISTTRITILANEGRIPGAQRVGKNWLIPVGATKPAERKSRRSGSAGKEAGSFTFPLYHFCADWNDAKAAQLSEQQRSLLAAESAVLECRFAEAYPMLESIMQAPDDISTEIGCLWNMGICCIALNRPEDFSKVFLRLQMHLSDDIPHRDDLAITLDALRSYVESMGSAADGEDFNTDIHDQTLPLLCLQVAYANLTREALNSGTADTALLELNLRLLKTTGAVIAVEMMHCYLAGIYYLRHNMEAVEKHAKAAVRIAFENKFYFPIVTYYRFMSPALSPVLEQYPKEFQNHCHELIAQFDKNYPAFISAICKDAIITKIADADYPYIFAVLTDLTNNNIAEKFGVSEQTVKRRLTKLCEKLGVKTKKELKDYLRSCM